MEIKMLTVINKDYEYVHTVGEQGVTQIQDNCIDAEQNYVPQYNVYVDGKMKYTYVNGVFEIEYKV